MEVVLEVTARGAPLISILAGGLVAKTREVKNVTILDLEGKICRHSGNEPTLYQFVKAELDRGKRNFIFNFQNVKFVDSFGVGEVVASYISCRSLGGKLKLACLPKSSHLALDPRWYFGKEEVVFATVEAALESFGEA
ncbi:MAG: STAS domain-containing protein [Candidatus Aminicenantales bacterium]|jgi:anti-anti-sigma factor